jgi:hypothetical protein
MSALTSQPREELTECFIKFIIYLIILLIASTMATVGAGTFPGQGSKMRGNTFGHGLPQSSLVLAHSQHLAEAGQILQPGMTNSC